MTGKHQVTFGFRDNLAPVQPGHDPQFVGLLNQTTPRSGSSRWDMPRASSGNGTSASNRDL
jgi:hypothetical protein